MHAKTLYQSSKNVCIIILKDYHGILSEGSFKLYSSLELLMLIAIRVKCFDAALQFWICL